jgi:WhiB family transcriptional regulator, redox-sensing transcriptional regulator
MSGRADWRDDALCRHAAPDLFFPIAAAGPALHQIDQAKRICHVCPVQTPCLTWALDHGVAAGVWGGATEDERHTIRAARISGRPGVTGARLAARAEIAQPSGPGEQ